MIFTALFSRDDILRISSIIILYKNNNIKQLMVRKEKNMKLFKKGIALLVIVAVFATSMGVFQSNVEAKPNKTAWKKVVKTLKKKGEIYGYGKKAYAISSGDYSIMTNKSGKWISFVYYDSTIHVQFELKKNKGSFKMNVKYVDSEAIFSGSKKFKIKKFNSRNHGVKYKIKIGYGTDKAMARIYINNYVTSAMKEFNSLLKSKTGVSFKKLGFKKF